VGFHVITNRVFFPQTALDQWIVDGAVELQDGELTILSESRRYKLAEGVHVMREVTGAGDPNELVGRVKSRAFLEELGAEIVEGSMLIGESAYDVEPGWLGSPIGALQQPSGGRNSFDPESGTDEDLLARFLSKKL
jgi:hypothetical protein